MRRRWLLAAVPAAALVLPWLARAPASPGGPAPGAPPRAPVRVLTRSAPAPEPGEAGGVVEPDEAGEGRQAVVRELPAEGAVGRMVQAAMAKPGDSDPRLLDLLAALGAAPSALASVGAAVDPWVAVGLVDLERQVARRCALRRDAQTCWATALTAEEEVAALLDDPGAAEALERFRAVDGEGSSGDGGVQGPDHDAR